MRGARRFGAAAAFIRVAASVVLVGGLSVSPLESTAHAGPSDVALAPVARALGSVASALGPARADAATQCTGWTSTTVPPTTIRVYRTTGPAAGTVQVVPFADYVKVVMAAEWGASAPTEALKAGAVAVKQYGWYHAMYWRGKSAPDGSCYDVVDSTVDQMYSPETKTPAQTEIDAVDATWTMTVLKNSAFFATHYDAGSNVACGTNATGWYLYQLSAMNCARSGMVAPDILTTYYDPGAQVLPGDGTGGTVGGPSPAVALAFRAQPADSVAGVAFAVQPVVAVTDMNGQTVTSGTGSDAQVTLSLVPPAVPASGSVTPTPAPTPAPALTCTGGLTRPAVAGIATFTGCSISGVVTGAMLLASAANLVPANTAPFNVAAPPILPASFAMPPTAVITWAQTATLSAHLVAPAPMPGVSLPAPLVGGVTVHLERSVDAVSWGRVADLVTDATGTVTWTERPATNIYDRLVFDGSASMGAATSVPVRVLVRRIAILRPDNGGLVRHVAAGTSVAFGTLVRPMRPDVPTGPVEYVLLRLVSGHWTTVSSWRVAPDSLGWARQTITFPSAGMWAVRSIAVPTPLNANSVWSPLERYAVP